MPRTAAPPGGRHAAHLRLSISAPSGGRHAAQQGLGTSTPPAGSHTVHKGLRTSPPPGGRHAALWHHVDPWRPPCGTSVTQHLTSPWWPVRTGRNACQPLHPHLSLSTQRARPLSSSSEDASGWVEPPSPDDCHSIPLLLLTLLLVSSVCCLHLLDCSSPWQPLHSGALSLQWPLTVDLGTERSALCGPPPRLCPW